MSRVIGLREDMQLALALKDCINQWLLTTNKELINAANKANSKKKIKK